MENIDDFMKKKMLDEAPGGGRPFEFKEEYWQQAEALIVADERRKRRRRFIWWWSAGLLLLALGAGAWWMLHISPQPDTIAQQMPPASQEHFDKQTDTAYTAFPKTPSNLSQQSNNTATRAPQPEGTNNATPNSSINSSPEKNSSAQQTNANLSAKTASGKKTPQPSPGSTDKPGSPNNSPRQQSSDAPTVAAGTTGAAGNAASETPGVPPADNTAAAASPVAAPLAVVALLPTRPLTPLRHLPPTLPPQKPRPSLPQAQAPTPDRRLQLDVFGLGSVYAPTASTQRYGAGAGISASWRLGQAWALQAAPMWRMRTMGAFPEVWEPQNTRQLRYSFGYTLDEYSLESTASHWLEIPVGVQWRKLPWTAEAGLAPGFLLGVQGRQTHAQEGSLEARTSGSQWVRLDDAPFYKNYFAVYAGGRYALGKKLGIGLRIHYLGGDFRRPSSEFTPPRQTFWLDAGLHWTLF
ncbi:MAG: hypothetical protein JNL02_07095 [Saprospiraceae bacterium]|nr:hypothetical protein [Saprospiraceae bacterium]